MGNNVPPALTGPRPDEARVRALGRELFERVKADRRAFYRADRWTAALFDWALRMEDAKLRLFRFVDVLPALAHDRDVARHLREYFEGQPLALSGLVSIGLGVSRAGWLGEKVVATVLRRAVTHLARRFIAGATPEEALRAAQAARVAGQAFTLDVLGEACVSEDEADQYQRRYLELVERLGLEAARWPSAPGIDRAASRPIPRVNVSVKLSALYPYLDPADPETGAAAVTARLRPILEAAQAYDAHIQIDMEERRFKDLTLRIFTEICDEPAFSRRRDVGVVMQAYLRESERDARRLIAWARKRGTPVTVRLVKGAYWDYETARAELEGWPVPVWEAKDETDASFERLTRLFMEASDAIDLAIGSHNIRSIAHALAVREALGLPREQLEFQTLYGMAAPLVRALAERGERVRIYMPFGELIPGMSYLVRRLLENTSNESFLRRGFVEDQPVDVLLADPGDAARGAGRQGWGQGSMARKPHSPLTPDPIPASPPPGPPLAGSPSADRRDLALREFSNEPATDFTLEAGRVKLAESLASVRTQLWQRYPLVIGGQVVETTDRLVSVDPSRPSQIVGYVSSASADDVDRAVVAAERALPAWRDLGATGRSEILGRAADVMRARRAELAAWIVYEAGKPWREADGEVAEAIDFIEYYRREAIALLEPQRLGRLRAEVNHYLREPRGVAGVIAPWNFPLSILTGMTTAALATGNTVVMKPAEQTPVIAAKLMAIFAEAGLPPGVLNYVPGRGEVAGARLVSHPAVQLIAFTGSREVGTRIYADAAQPAKGARHVKRVVAEMGGKNAVIVDDDADLDEAVQGIIVSTFGYAGQKCSACSRVIAVGRVYERLTERLVAAARTLPMGPADAPGTIVGPVIDAPSQEKIAGYIDLGKRIARPALVRELPDALARSGGYYVAPAIFADVAPSSPLAQEEIFGPVLSILPARSFDDALAIALDTDFALTGGVFSRSPVHLKIARDRFRVGNLYINRPITGAMVGRQPFGGRQLSGIGYQAGGPDYLLQFVEARVVSENTLRRGFAETI
jgi:RHH-type proline utilization regulon transcriptional repressor/proline dehydrogenase/delta 1-pyrroline-5-carboxylate dehydrogenase